MGPKVLLETRDRRPSRKLATESSVEDPRKDQSQCPPPLEPSKAPETHRQGRRDTQSSGLKTDRDTTKEGPSMPKKGTER